MGLTASRLAVCIGCYLVMRSWTIMASQRPDRAVDRYARGDLDSS